MNACSFWIDSIGVWDWSSCCNIHDISYEIQIDKTLADLNLAHCVNTILPGMGWIMWVGVTVFGGLFYTAARISMLRNKKQKKLSS